MNRRNLVLDLGFIQLTFNVGYRGLQRIHTQRQHRTVCVGRQKRFGLFAAVSFKVTFHDPLRVCVVNREMESFILRSFRIANRLNVPQNVAQNPIHNPGVPIALDALHDLNRLVDCRRCWDLREEHNLVERNTHRVLHQGKPLCEFTMIETCQHPVETRLPADGSVHKFCN